VGKIGSPSTFRRSKGQDAGIFQQRKLLNREKRSRLSILGGHVASNRSFQENSRKESHPSRNRESRGQEVHALQKLQSPESRQSEKRPL
jgi:hypothetical protein